MNPGEPLRNQYPVEKALAAQLVPAPKTQDRARRGFLRWMLCGGTGVIGSVFFSQLCKNSSISVAGSLPMAATSTKTGSIPRLTKIQFTSVKLDSYGKIVSQPVRQAEIFTEDLGNGISLKMVKIPAGKFIMGSPANEEKRYDHENPQHQVIVPGFYLSS
jgi:eukaryotic-like serine/threonine-protein kinase